MPRCCNQNKSFSCCCGSCPTCEITTCILLRPTCLTCIVYILHPSIELMYNRAEENSAKLEETLNLREQWKDRGDNLLYAMLPRQVAEVLRQGKHPLDTCQVRAGCMLWTPPGG